MVQRVLPRQGARALARRTMTAELSALAVDLVLQQGYATTTVDDICAAAGVSRSTFFRYFPSKEDALLNRLVDAPAELLQALEARPLSERPWLALRQAFGVLIDYYNDDTHTGQLVAQLISQTPELAAKHHVKNAYLVGLLAPEIGRRLGPLSTDTPDPRPTALVAAALGCVDASVRIWVQEHIDAGLDELLDLAMDTIPL